MKEAAIKKLLFVFGLLNVLAYSAWAVMSYFLVTVTPFGIRQENEASFFSSFAQRFWFLGEGFRDLLTGNNVFQNEIAFAAAAAIPLFVSSVVFVFLIAFLSRNGQEIPESVPHSLFRWSVAFAVVGSLAVPVIAQDFWLSVAWGRMAAGGFNPYYADLSIEFARNIPLDALDQRMTYGPLWALVSGFIVFIAGGNGFLAAVLFKILLAAAWVGSLTLVRKLLLHHQMQKQCLGLAVFGWLPLSVGQIATEGHNDIVMVFLMLLWLYFLERGRITGACLALAGSFLIKYITAPLFVLEVIYLFCSRKLRVSSYLPSLIYAGMMILAVFGLFYRSPDFFASTTSMRDWHFFTPSDAVKLGVSLIRGPGWLRYLPMAAFAAIAGYGIIRYAKSPTTERFRYAVLAGISAILYCSLGHIWPWFLLWVLPLAALLPDTALSRFNIGVALAFPFVIVFLQLSQLSAALRWEWAGFLMYVFAVTATVFSLIAAWYKKKEAGVLPTMVREQQTARPA